MRGRRRLRRAGVGNIFHGLRGSPVRRDRHAGHAHSCCCYRVDRKSAKKRNQKPARRSSAPANTSPARPTWTE
ncbi:hypothetical protein GWL_19610 [Herbaspirillum sp. GW103]|nr:hypothetical protein GWL_19610 [Herbaspirillum sp. GW103]